MRIRTAALGVALTTTGVLGMAVPAHATPAATKPSYAKVVGPVKLDADNPEVGYVKVQYRCYGEGAFWVSVKQVADGSADPRLTEEGSSAISSSWSDSHRNTLTCDGTRQVATLTVDQVEPYYTQEGPQGQKSDIYDPLRRGKGYVQLCLFDQYNPDIPLSDFQFRSVVPSGHARV